MQGGEQPRSLWLFCYWGMVIKSKGLYISYISLWSITLNCCGGRHFGARSALNNLLKMKSAKISLRVIAVLLLLGIFFSAFEVWCYQWHQDWLTPQKVTQATLRSHFATLCSGHLTGDIRFGIRLAPHPNFAPSSQNFVYLWRYAKCRVAMLRSILHIARGCLRRSAPCRSATHRISADIRNVRRRNSVSSPITSDHPHSAQSLASPACRQAGSGRIKYEYTKKPLTSERFFCYCIIFRLSQRVAWSFPHHLQLVRLVHS